MTGPSPSPTRTMALWSPDWPITAIRHEHGVPADAPIALIDCGVVFACSAAARREGVRRGLRLREAQSRCTDLIVFAYDQAIDNRAFEPVITAIEHLAPGVQLLRPGTCAIRAQGPARYYGGEKPAALALIGALGDLGIPGTLVGVADGPFAAEMAARGRGMAARGAVRIIPEGGSPDFLAPLPIGILEQPQLASLLRRLGVHTLGQFAALPATDVRDRFGEPGARVHTLAAGHDSRPVTARIPPRQFEQLVDFEPALDRIDQVTFGVLAASEAFIASLIAATFVCTAIRVEVETESGESSGRSWLHPRSFTAPEVVDRVRWQLQGGGQIDSGLRSGVTRVRITPESLDSIGNHEHGLWGTGPDERIHHGLSRVQSMLGHDAVLTAAVGGGRSLADRQSLVAWGDRLAPGPGNVNRPQQPWPGQLPTPSPSTVFTVAHPVHVFAAGGEPVTVDGRGTLSAPPAQLSGVSGTLRDVVAWAGPWTVDERWWDAETRRRVSRFQLVDSSGSAWLLVLDGEHWSAEARYD